MPSAHPHSYVLILDDHPLVARGMGGFLRALLPGMEVREATTTAQGWDAIAQHGAPRLALVDFWLAEGAALDVVASLRAQCPHTAIAMVSGDDDPALAARARDAGAQGFIHKQEPPEVFGQAVQALLNGLAWHMPPAPAAAARSRELPVTPAELGLSARQGDILALVLQGLPNKRIALRYGLSESTVKEHVSGILQRLGARTRVEAITSLRGRRLLLPEPPQAAAAATGTAAPATVPAAPACAAPGSPPPLPGAVPGNPIRR